MWGGYGWGWMGPFMGVSAVLWWVLVVVIVIGVVRWVRSPQVPVYRGATDHGVGGGVGDAREVLDLRFARGEIDADEYAERRRLLTGG